MPLPPIKISDAVQKAAYDDLAKGAMRKFGDAITILADRVLHPRKKSTEELALDWLAGEQEGENRRRLAAEALDGIPLARRIFPASQIAGPIFRDSEFEIPGSPIWHMWKELLSRACDSDRVDEAHPAYVEIIKQLSPDEAKLVAFLAAWKPDRGNGGWPRQEYEISDVGIHYRHNLPLYLEHIETLGLILPSSQATQRSWRVQIDRRWTHLLSVFGQHFARAVSPPSEEKP